MKSPAQIAQQLARRWQRADWREQHLLNAQATWPLRLPIGQPGTHSFRDASADLRTHLQQWKTVDKSGLGTVQWEQRMYRGGAAPIDVPTCWTLARPSECMAAINRFAGVDGAQTLADHRALAAVLVGVDARFHRLLLRRLALWRAASIENVITAAGIAQQLQPGCARGKPLRALSVAGNDSKFFERHAALLTALLDEVFDGEPSRQGLITFLGASSEDDHWLLVAPLAAGLLPYVRQRIPASELHDTALPARRILVVENERCLHQLPFPLHDTIAVLGAGLNLGWLAASWLRERDVAYWGDMDTWGLHMLAGARRHLPHLHPLLMDRTTFDAHRHLAVPEPVHATESPNGALPPEQTALDQYLRTLKQGRLEQEFLPQACVNQAIQQWLPASHAET